MIIREVSNYSSDTALQRNHCIVHWFIILLVRAPMPKGDLDGDNLNVFVHNMRADMGADMG